MNSFWVFVTCTIAVLGGHYFDTKINKLHNQTLSMSNVMISSITSTEFECLPEARDNGSFKLVCTLPRLYKSEKIEK
jgi:hypothetical protein